MSSSAAAIRSARVRRGLTQKELAAILGIDHSMVSRIEHGLVPSPMLLARLASTLRLTLSASGADSDSPDYTECSQHLGAA